MVDVLLQHKKTEEEGTWQEGPREDMSQSSCSLNPFLLIPERAFHTCLEISSFPTQIPCIFKELTIYWDVQHDPSLTSPVIPTPPLGSMIGSKDVP